MPNSLRDNRYEIDTSLGGQSSDPRRILSRGLGCMLTQIQRRKKRPCRVTMIYILLFHLKSAGNLLSFLTCFPANLGHDKLLKFKVTC